MTRRQPDSFRNRGNARVDAAHFAEFLQNAGYRVIRSESGYWYEASRLVYLSIPPDITIDPSEGELREIFRKHRILGVKFSSSGERGKEGALYILEDKEYDLPNLHIKHRPYVRKGIDRCEVREIDFDYLANHGLQCALDTLKRQGRRDPHFEEPRLWKMLCDAGKRTPGAGIWASFAGETLAAFMIYFVVDGTCHLLYEMSRSDYMLDRELRKFYPNHALQFLTMKNMIRRDGIDRVSGGFESFLELRNLDRYKRYAGYEKCPVRYIVVLNPVAGRMLQNRLFEVLLGLSARIPLTKDLALRTRNILEIARLS